VNRDRALPGIRFALLDTLVLDTSSVVLEGAYRNRVWIPIEACDTCMSGPSPDPGFMLYNDFGDKQVFPWTGPVNMAFSDRESNPLISEGNPSELTGKVVRDSGKWANVHFDLSSTLDLSTYSTFKVKAYYQGDEPVPESAKVRLILRNKGNGLTQYSLEQRVKVAKQWVEYSFNCAGALGRDDYNQVWLFFSSPDENNIAVGHTYYIDDLMGPLVRIPQTYTLTFSVSDEDTGGKLKDVQVEVGEEVRATNIHGEAEFSILEGAYSYLVSEPGYYPVESSLELIKDTLVHVELVKSSATLKFRVYAGDLPLKQAGVAVDTLVQLTNQVGIVLYEDLPRFEEYSYLVEKEGYESDSGRISLRGDTTVNVSLELMSSAFYSGSTSIRIYPNPVVSTMYVVSEQALLRAELLSLQGLLIQSYSREELQEAVDLSLVSPGMYVLKIYPEVGAPTIKPVILSK
jgi:hypothetical protein